MKALLIDPHLQTVTEVEYGGVLEDLYRLTHCEIVEAVGIGKGDVVYVDEEGLFHDPAKQAFFVISDFHQPLAGYGLVVGVTGSGADASPKTTLAQLRGRVSFVIPRHQQA